jgi:exodeoxyribonuclease V beta subunit
VKAVGALDASSVALQGLNVIEANAGTGKTWTITALYVRLLLEAHAAVDSILVVTFTEAATGELRDRLRKRLADTRIAFERGAADANDGFTAALLERTAQHDEAMLRLMSALHDFDQAPIYTIHGYCQRVLGDRAFESGMPFRTQIVPDQSALTQEIVEDFWRRQTHAASPLYTRFLIARGAGPRTLAKEVERYLGKPYLEIRRPVDPGPLATLELEYGQACSNARRVWLGERAGISAKLIGSTSLSGTTYRQSAIPGWLDEMHACLAPESPQLELCHRFDKFTPEALAKGTRKGMSPPAHPFFDACRALRNAHTALSDAYERSLVLMKVALLEYCNAELALRKSQRQLQSYDDLLLNLHKALHDDENGDRLAAHLRARYPIALIDEFQDTDPVQYGIFRRIYAGTDQSVFLVGDPKQSIYSFRGADVYSYLAARRDAQASHTLAVNWRSEPTLLSAVNHLFENVEAPFVIGDIPFVPSRSAPGERGRFVIDAEAGSAPFTVWLVESADGKPVNKGAATEAAAQATAAEIARLLNLGARNAARIVEPAGERPLRGGDIAVLARSHRQAMAVNEALAALGIASVQRGAHSVFCTPEAGELERVLAAVAEPGREALIGAALATEMMGTTGEALHVLQGDETRWEQIVESFREAHRAWHQHGFMHMLRAFLQRYGVIPRLLEYADGERRATNLLHLAELLHCEVGRQGMDAVLARLSAKRAAPSDAIEAELLRLESDENLVKLLTVHAAKGLEFPLVFCPFVWDGGLRSVKADVLAFHDPERHYVPVVDFGSDGIDAAREQAICEERAESLRHLYVALTRAKYRCWMVWGNVNDAASAAPAWLLHRPPRDQSAEARAFGTAELPRLDRIRADLERIASGAGGAIGIAALPVAAEMVSEAGVAVEQLPGARRFEGVIRDTRYVTSFTALAHGRGIEAPDYDAADREPLPESVSGRDIYAFPRGAQAGRCVHAIFEHVDFARLTRAELERVVQRELAAHGFDAMWLRALAAMVEAVLDTPLDASGMRLRGISRERRLDELEFYYPIGALNDRMLRRLLADAGLPAEIRERVGSLTFSPTQGYMRGFIDLVFEHEGRYYLADYKSNWLGATPDAYCSAALATVMGREAYYLQYLLYCVALHRYLGSRLPGYRYESHFGGVRYLFVRGMQPVSGATGVYADRPAASVIAALDEYLRNGAL